MLFPGAGHLVHGLARGRRGGRGRPAPDRPRWRSRWPTGSSPARRRPARRGCGAGLRRRESQARCPQLHVVTADPARDARHFEDVTAAVDDLVPRAEVLRPGLLVLPVRGAARYFGSEQAAAERLVDAVAAAGPNARSASPISCPPRSSPRGQAGSSSRAGRAVLVRAVDPAAGHRAEPGGARS